MKQTKIISKFLHYVCYILAMGYLISLFYSAFCLSTGFGIESYDRDQFLHINYPLGNQIFLIVENNISYIVFSFLLPLILYSIFFMLSTRLFKVFFQNPLFTQKNISELKRFYLFNIFVPLPIIIIASFFVDVESLILVLAFIHFILGIFSLFFANIFSEGLQLQNEQDLYI